MGMFLSMSGVIGKSHEQVADSLVNYAKTMNGGLMETELNSLNNNACVIEEHNGNTTILYPNDYLEWDKSSEFISKELNAAVFSFHIHDGDLWMYILYVNGAIVDQFNPIPEYWDENITEEEIKAWDGNAEVVSKYVSGLNPKNIEKYLIYWSENSDQSVKAYSEDRFSCEDWQLIDFMKKVGLIYPVDDDDNPTGKIYELWTNELNVERKNLSSVDTIINAQNKISKKPWWKFW